MLNFASGGSQPGDFHSRTGLNSKLVLRHFSGVTQRNGASIFCLKKPWTISDKMEFMLGDWSGVDPFERIRRQDELSRR